MGSRGNSAARNHHETPRYWLLRPQACGRRAAAGLAHPLEEQSPDASKKQIRQIAESLKQFGWTNPVLVDDDGGIIAGHGRVEAARLLGYTSQGEFGLAVSKSGLKHLMPSWVNRSGT
jgi:hypothetical protein